MSNIEKIRQEIERRLQRENEILWNAKKRGTYPSPSCEYNLLTLTSLRDFIDSLPEEFPPYCTGFKGDPDLAGTSDLEEAAARYERENRESILSSVDIVDGFKAGAEWQRKQECDTSKVIPR